MVWLRHCTSLISGYFTWSLAFEAVDVSSSSTFNQAGEDPRL